MGYSIATRNLNRDGEQQQQQCRSPQDDQRLLAGIAQWLQRRTRDGKVAASSPQRWNFLLRGQLCILTLISVSVACHSAKGVGGRLQLNAYAPHICGSEGSDTVNWRMVVWCTQNVPRDGSSFTWRQPCNNQIALRWIYSGGGGSCVIGR